MAASRLRFAALAAVAAWACALPAHAESRTVVEITAFSASPKGRTLDRRLVHLRNELRDLSYKSFRYVGSQKRELRGNGEQSGMELPGGRYLHITTREHTPDHLRLHILLNENNRPSINTYVKLELGSVILLGDDCSRHGDDTLFIAIGSQPAEAAMGAPVVPGRNAVPPVAGRGEAATGAASAQAEPPSAPTVAPRGSSAFAPAAAK